MTLSKAGLVYNILFFILMTNFLLFGSGCGSVYVRATAHVGVAVGRRCALELNTVPPGDIK